MYDELVKWLREFASLPEYCENVDDCDKCTKEDLCLSFTNERISDVATQAADAIEELSKPCWIPVTERLPEAGERVLCYCRANIYEVMKMRTDGNWVYDTNHIYMHSFVTHWMPLPQPPKEE